MSTPTYRDYTGSAAENYEKYFVPTIATAVAADLLRTADLQPGERVCDVACGTGVITRMAAERVGPGGSVTGVDVAPDMIAIAEASMPSAGVDVAWHVADAAALPLPDASADVVLCQMGLMFMEDQLGALREMHRVLAPGGRVVVNTPGTIQPFFELLERAIVEHIDPALGGFVRAVFSMPDPDALAALLADAGFAAASATVTVARFVLPAPADFLWQYVNLTPLALFVGDAPEAARAALERAVVEGSKPFVTDGHLIVDQPMVVAHARSG